MGCLLYLTAGWFLLLCGVQALSMDLSGGAKVPSSFVEVLETKIAPLEHQAGEWLVSLQTVSAEEIQFVVKEQWQFGDEKTVSVATKGYTYTSDGTTRQLQGRSRLVISTDGVDHRARGSFEVHGETWHLTELWDTGYIIWKEKDLLEGSEGKLGGAVDDEDQQHILRSRSLELQPLSRSLQTSVGDTAGCPNTTMVARIGVAADSNFMKTFNSSDEARAHIVDTINKASQVWEQAFNITLALGKLILANDSYPGSWNIPCQSQEDNVSSMQDRLNALSQWRSESALRSADGLAQWTMFTDCPSGNVVGLAWQSSSCRSSAANVIHHSLLDYRVLAHETGHVFGAVHDCTSQSCAANGQESTSDTAGSPMSCCPFSADSCDAGGQFIMNPASSTQQYRFSPCSQGNVCGAIGSRAVDTTCLVAQGTNTTRSGNTCPSDLSSEPYRKCRQDLQCIEATGQQETYACSDSGSCTMKCYDARSKQCVEQQNKVFADDTPCGFGRRSEMVCKQGQCKNANRPNNPFNGGGGSSGNDGGFGGGSGRLSGHRGMETWVWVVILVASVVGGLTLLAILTYLMCRSRRRQPDLKARQPAPPGPVVPPPIIMNKEGRAWIPPNHSATTYETTESNSMRKVGEADGTPRHDGQTYYTPTPAYFSEVRQ